MSSSNSFPQSPQCLRVDQDKNLSQEHSLGLLCEWQKSVTSAITPGSWSLHYSRAGYNQSRVSKPSSLMGEKTSFTFFCLFDLTLFERQNEKGKKGDRKEKGGVWLSWYPVLSFHKWLPWLELSQVESRSQELHTGFSHEWQVSKPLDHLLLPFLGILARSYIRRGEARVETSFPVWWANF